MSNSDHKIHPDSKITIGPQTDVQLNWSKESMFNLCTCIFRVKIPDMLWSFLKRYCPYYHANNSHLLSIDGILGMVTCASYAVMIYYGLWWY